MTLFYRKLCQNLLNFLTKLLGFDAYSNKILKFAKNLVV